MYTALKLHFTPGTYDFFKYHGKVKNITPQNFETRKDRWFFHKLSKVHSDESECAFFIAANMFQRDKLWVRDLLGNEAEDIYREKLRVKESLHYIMTGDLAYLISHESSAVEQMKEIVRVGDGQAPRLLEMAQQRDIAVETLIALNTAINFLPVWEKKLNDTILFPVFKHKCLAYEPFLGIDKKKVRELVKSKLTNA
jgi:hypothetical protein